MAGRPSDPQSDIVLKLRPRPAKFGEQLPPPAVRLRRALKALERTFGDPMASAAIILRRSDHN